MCQISTKSKIGGANQTAEAIGRLRLAAVDVDRVAHRLERVEADPGRQDDVQRPQRQRAQAGTFGQRLEARDEEVVIFEEAKDAEIGHHADGQERDAPGLLACRIQPREQQTGRGGTSHR